ncbi:MAG: PTS system mannose/fructose/N-acetylgalactosamine-transporter subunit IIB [Anaerolineae bacterium]
MKEWGLVRIDDRLIHGQVIAVWCKHKKFERIVIIDDQVASDTFMQQVLKMAAPPNLTVDVYGVEEAVKILRQDDVKAETTMLLMKTPETARRLFDQGVTYEALNVGGMGSGPGRKNVFKNIAMSKEDVATLKYLMDQGVKITLLTVPGEKSKAFSDLVAKL